MVLNPLDRSGVRAHAQDAGQKPSQRNGEMMNIGDIVLVKGNFQVQNAPEVTWPECYGQVGVVVELLHAVSTLPLANVMVLGGVDQFYIDELEIVNEYR